MRISDWSSDVCSSDLDLRHAQPDEVEQGARHAGGDIAMGGIEAADALGGGGFVIETAAHGSAPWLGSTEHRRTGPGFCDSRHFVTGGRRSEEHTSELQSLMRIPYAVFCLKKKKTKP